MKRTDIKKTINKLCLESKMSNAEFANKIYDAMDELNSKYDYPEISTINRWYNGRTVPNEQWFPYIAKALGKTEHELNGDIDSLYQKKIDDLSKLLEIREEERTLVEKIVWLDSEGLILLAAMLIEYSSILANATYLKNGFLFLISTAALVCTVLSFNKRFPDPENCKTLKDKTKSDMAFINKIFELSKQKSLIFGILINYFFIVVLVAFLPFIELCFYKGTYHISVFVQSFVSIAMILRGLYNR